MTTIETAPIHSDAVADEGPLRVAVIVGSTREGRACKAIADWFIAEVRHRPDIDMDVIDLADFHFPPRYTMQPTPAIEAFSQRIDRADAFVVVTPEYNHSYPASLKLALDYTRNEWHGKAVGFISYGGAAQGTRAVEQLRLVFAELHTVTIRDQLSFDLRNALGPDGRPADDGARHAATAVVDQLCWWGLALREARAARPYGS